MLTAISIFVLALGFIFPSKKSITYLMLLYMWFIFAFNTMNGDYIAYAAVYKRIGDGYLWTISHYEIGFVAACELFYRVFKLSYEQFIVVVALFSTILFGIVIRLYSKLKKQNIIIALFVIVEYWMMICQYRFYIGMLFALIGLYLYMHNDGIKGTLLYLLFIALGVTFHNSIALFLLLMIAKKLSIKQCFYVIPISIGALLLIRMGWLSSIINMFIPAHKIENWIYSEGNRSASGIAFLLVIRILLLLVEYFVQKKERVKFQFENPEYIATLENILKITIISGAYNVLEMINKNYERMFRIPLFLFFVFLSYYIAKHKINVRRVPMHYLVCVGYIFIYMISFYISFDGWFVHNLIPILTYNSILGWGGV